MTENVKKSSFSKNTDDQKAGITFEFPVPAYMLSAIAGAEKYGQSKVDAAWCAGVVVKFQSHLRTHFKDTPAEEITEDAILEVAKTWIPGEMRQTVSPLKKMADALKAHPLHKDKSDEERLAVAERMYQAELDIAASEEKATKKVKK